MLIVGFLICFPPAMVALIRSCAGNAAANADGLRYGAVDLESAVSPRRRGGSLRLAPILILAAIAGWGTPLRSAASQESADQTAPRFVWKQSLPIRPGDPGIGEIGGTEIRALAALDGHLFAANGYWMDAATDNPALPGAQVLRLDGPDSPWRVDLQLDERNPFGRRLYLAISILEKVRFTADSNGRPLSPAVEMLLAAAWKRGPGLEVFSRVAGGGARPWSKTTIPGQESAPRLRQIRSFAVHKDAVTGGDMVFAGATNAIFVGRYDRERRKIEWDSQPDWQSDSAELSNRTRVSSLVDCAGRLYAGVYDTIYQRVDGPSPTWRKVFETTIHVKRRYVTGFRGLTCARAAAGAADVLLASVEDGPSRIYRIEPAQDFKASEELDVTSFLTRALNTQATYAIPAYNHMTAYPDPTGSCVRYLIGFEVTTPDAAETFHTLYPSAYFLVRECNGDYALREIRDPRIEPKPQLESVRTLAPSPFPDDPPGTLYAGGFDTNHNQAHNTAWLYKGAPAAASGAN